MSMALVFGRPCLSGSAPSAMCKRWIIANGLAPAVRHSTVVSDELNGANQTLAAGSSAAASRLRPTETTSRRSSSAIRTTSPSLPLQTRVVLPSSSLGLPIWGDSFGAVGVSGLRDLAAILRGRRGILAAHGLGVGAAETAAHQQHGQEQYGQSCGGDAEHDDAFGLAGTPYHQTS